MVLEITTFIEEIKGDILRAQSINFNRFIENKENEEIFYWDISLSNNIEYENYLIDYGNKSYIDIDFFNNHYHKIKSNLYYKTSITREPISGDAIFRLPKENKLRNYLNISDEDYYIVFELDYNITEKLTKELTKELLLIKNKEKIYNYFYKILSNNSREYLRKRNEIPIINSSDILNNIFLINKLKVKLHNRVISKHPGLIIQMINIMKKKGIGIKKLSAILNMIDYNIFPVYSEDLYKYLKHNNLLVEVQYDNLESKIKNFNSIVKYLEYAICITEIINECCEFKLGLMLDDKNETIDNFIKLINHNIYYNFSFLDIL